jgi:hypothetical protein
MKNFISSGKCQGRSLSFPMTKFFDTAAMREIINLIFDLRFTTYDSRFKVPGSKWLAQATWNLELGTTF